MFCTFLKSKENKIVMSFNLNSQPIMCTILLGFTKMCIM